MCCTISQHSYAQESNYRPLSAFHGDTAQYILTNFVHNQVDYKNKKLKILFNRLEVPIVRSIPDISVRDKTDPIQVHMKCRGIYLEFFDAQTVQAKVKNGIEPAVLFINFKNLLTADEAIGLISKDENHRAQLTDSAKKFYGNLLVDSIVYVHYKLKY